MQRITIIFALLCNFIALPLQAIGTYLISDGQLTTTLDMPGHYLLVQDLSFAPVSTATGIFITASNVSLDLMGYNLAQSNGVAQVTAIAISPGLSDVTIQNGVITNCSDIGITIGAGCEQIMIEGITVTGCGRRGIDCAGTAAQPLRAVLIQNCNFLSTCTLTTADNVITFSNVRDSWVDNCWISTCGSGLITGTCTMLQMTSAQHCKVSNLQINSGVGRFDLRGISLSDGSNNIFTNCVVNGLLAVGGGSVSRGFQLESNTSATANVFKDCIAMSITATSVVDGFLSDTTCNDNLFENCRSMSHLARDVSSICHGFRAINNNRNRFVGCYALTCSSLSTVASPLFGTYGFRFDTTTGSYAENCLALDNTAAVAGRGVGYFIFATTNCTIIGCKAARNTVGFDASNLSAANFNLQAFVANFSMKNLSANYNTNATAWQANAATSAASNSNLNAIATRPHDNIGIP